MKDDAREWWNAWADAFQANDIDVAVAWGPGAPEGDDLGLLGDVDGTRAIELGCGGGQFGLALAERGADVTGVDISEAQLEYARENATERDADVDFVQTSVTDLDGFDDASFDLAFSAFAFQWIADLDAAFEEAYRVLEPGGRLVYSVDHPFYKTVDPETHEVTGSYFDDEPRRVYSERFDAEMVIYARGIGDTVSRLTDAGFQVEAVREPGYSDPEAYENDFGSFEPEAMAKVPPTVVYAARKPASS
ncbi:class I SAM-dependent methyltransferase [Halorubellus salinus]|uniref:class I SAM-dependent methyltransferase n=1 Tax=Halorubellus salinus TaxID=755309 RepID=UPI001D062EB3|nr:class I SAM-dependent methyltransferase [Halorubellus salinus]